ncbi:MAG: hypothetical protein GXP38_14875 [Chloroflexi bacterium]|nr:hypothetical protein [Chloroflexota bacterium]
MMKYTQRIPTVLAFTIFMFLILVSTALASGNDFVVTKLRTDLAYVTTGQYLDYRHYIYDVSAPSSPMYSSYTTGWFSVDLHQYNGTLYSAQFTQVGIITENNQARWFVYSEAGVECLQGTAYWGNFGCLGSYGQFGITPGNNKWTVVEAVTYNGQSWWILRVYDTQGFAHDVAKVLSGSKQIFRADANSEEAYTVTNDPHVQMNFYHYHPEYWDYGINGFHLWPGVETGDPQHNILYTAPSGICPTWYGATTMIQNNPHLWRDHSGGQTCYKDPLF